ncbi:(Fe-S)-binding protein [Marinobacteraceae bacterium S3BR75-40.1]
MMPTQSVATPRNGISGQVYLFGTCLVDLFYPDAGMAAVALLEQQGLQVHFPQGQTCCGQPPYNSGYEREARAVARKQVPLFPEPWPIVVPSASCAGMLTHQYPRLLAGTDMEQQAHNLAGRVWELTAFLHRYLGVELQDRGAPVTIAVHGSCSARRELPVHRDTLALLEQLERVTVVEPEDAETCCGFGGTFAVKQAELSASLAQSKARALQACGANLLISGEGGCLMNIAGVLDHGHADLPQQHIAEFLWERTRSGARP